MTGKMTTLNLTALLVGAVGLAALTPNAIAQATSDQSAQAPSSSTAPSPPPSAPVTHSSPFTIVLGSR